MCELGACRNDRYLRTVGAISEVVIRLGILLMKAGMVSKPTWNRIPLGTGCRSDRRGPASIYAGSNRTASGIGADARSSLLYGAA